MYLRRSASPTIVTCVLLAAGLFGLALYLSGRPLSAPRSPAAPAGSRR